MYLKELAGDCSNSNCSLNEKCVHDKYRKETHLKCVTSGISIWISEHEYYFLLFYHLTNQVYEDVLIIPYNFIPCVLIEVSYWSIFLSSVVYLNYTFAHFCVYEGVISYVYNLHITFGQNTLNNWWVMF